MRIGRWLGVLIWAALMSSIGMAGDVRVFTLQESIEYALKHSKAVALAEEKVRAAEAALMEARSRAMPQISTNASYLYYGKLPKVTLELPALGGLTPQPAPAMNGLQQPLTGVGLPTREMQLTMGAKKNFQAGVTVQQVLFAGGSIYNSIKGAELNLEAARLDLEATRQEVIYQVKEAFYGVLLAHKLLDVARKAVKQAEEHRKTAENLVKSGVATKYDLLRARVAVANAKSQLIQAQNALRLAKERFKLAIGFEGPGEVDVKGELKAEEVEFDLSRLLEKALQNRPDLRAMRLRAESASKMLNAAKGSFLPTVSLIGNYGYTDNEKQEGQTTWSVMVRADLPIFTGASRYSRVRQAESAMKQARLGVERMEEGVKLEVRAAYMELERARATLEAQKEAVKQAEEGLRIANLQYRNGVITSVQLADAELVYTQAQLGYYQALHDYVLAIAKIKKAIGEE